jgi:hypothetical protein
MPGRKAADTRLLDGPFLDVLDPSGNRIEVVEYRDVQFTKSAAVLRTARQGSDGLSARICETTKRRHNANG